MGLVLAKGCKIRNLLIKVTPFLPGGWVGLGKFRHFVNIGF
jgi:hypothetical protein